MISLAVNAQACEGQRLRRGQFIRDKLRSGDPPWQVKELRANDLSEGAALVERLKRAMSAQ